MPGLAAVSATRHLLLASFASLILSAAFGLYLARHDPPFQAGDSSQYVALGWNLVHGRYAREPLDQPPDPEPVRAIGYPAFLATIYAVTGYRQEPVVAAQALLLAGMVWTTFAAARLAVGRSAALAAAWVVALWPVAHFRAAELMSETITLALLSLALLFALAGKRQGSVALAALCGLSLGLAAMVRPAWLGLPVALAGAWLLLRDGRPLAQRVLPSALVVVLGVGLGSVWLARNSLVFGSPTAALQGGPNLFYAVHQTHLSSGEFGRAYALIPAAMDGDEARLATLSPAGARFAREMGQIALLQRRMRQEMPPHPFLSADVRAQVAIEPIYVARAVDIIRADPLAYVRARVTRGLPLLLFGTLPVHWQDVDRVPTLVLRLLLVPGAALMALAALGLWRHRRQGAAWLLAAAYGYGVIAHLPQLADGRFLEPLLLVPATLGGAGGLWLWERAGTLLGQRGRLGAGHTAAPRQVGS